jgi:hypothetical protein
MRLVFAIFSLFLMVGCGNIHYPDVRANKDLQVYVNRFAQVAQEQNFPIAWGSSRLVVDFDSGITRYGANVIGICTSSAAGNIVGINPTYWNRWNTTNSDREQLVFHELGHCVLGRGHDSAELFVAGYTLPKTIMNPTHTSVPWIYENNWEYYVAELFRPFLDPTVLYAQGAVSQFPEEYYDHPELVPSPAVASVQCKIGADCPEVVTKTFATTENEIGEGFHCGEVSN